MELRGAVTVRLPAALTASGVRELRAALRGASRTRGCRAIVLAGADAATFCEGLDLAGAVRAKAVRKALEDFAACLRALRGGPAVTLAVVRGRASGGGVGLAAACDAVVAAPGATFGLPELVFGLTPAIVAPYLTERMPPQKVRWLALSGDRFDADAALRAGLVDRVCADGAEDALLRSWVRHAVRLDPEAVRLWKRAAPAPSSSGHGAARQTLRRLRDPGVAARIRAFVENGDAPWE